MKGEKYTCANCEKEYEKAWTDEEANAEAALYFGKHPDEWKVDKITVCDDCYTEMFPPNKETFRKPIRDNS